MAEIPAVPEPRIDPSASFINLSYYFSLPIEHTGRSIDAMDRASWPLRSKEYPIWHRTRRDSPELLEHLVEWTRPDRNTQGTEHANKDDYAHFWQIGRDVLQSRRGLACGRGYRWYCTIGGTRKIPVEVTSVSAAIFTAGVGMVTLHITSPSSASADWFDLAHYLRFSEGQRSVEILVEAASPEAAGILDALQWPVFVPGDGAPERTVEAAPRQLGHVISRILRATFGHEEACEWEPIGACMKGQLVPYCVLFLDGVTESSIPEYLYRLRNFLRLDQFVALPQTAPSGRLSRGTFEHSRGLHFTFSVDGGGFLACNAPTVPFFRTTLPAHLRGPYFLAFLFAYYQRAVLLRLSAMIARSWGSGAASRSPVDVLAGFERARLVLFAFTARGYFSQVMQKQLHQEVYEQWRHMLRLQDLYNEVNSELEQMVQYLNAKRNDQIEKGQRTLNHLVFMFGLPSLYLAYVQTAKADLSRAAIACGALAAALIGLAIAGIAGRLIRPRR